MTKRLTIRGKTLIALMAFAALAFAGCKNFMKSDDDVKDKIQQEVDIANAPVVSVKVQSSATNLGSVTPNGASGFKLNVPSTVLASELAGGFIKWQAFYDSDYTTPVTGAVQFSAPTQLSTSATVLQNRPDIVIQALFEKRPTVASYIPDPLNGACYLNTPIRITFSKPINLASLSTTVDGVTTSNITIKESFAGSEPDITTTNYEAPTLSDDKLTVTFKGKLDLDPGYKLIVTVGKAVTDTSGLQMADDYTFALKIGTDGDRVPPVLGSISGGLTTSYEFPADAAARRVTGGTVNLNIKGDDEGSGVERAVIDAYLSKWDDAGTATKVAYASKTIPWLRNTGTATSFTDAELSAAGVREDGLITFSVVLMDLNQNSSAPTTYSFVRDTTPPPVSDAQLARVQMAGSTSGGFYNKNSTITFSQNSSDPLVDAGYAGASTRVSSSTVYYRFAVNASAFPDATTGWTASTSSVNIPMSGITDGTNVPVIVQLRDDLGNTSAVKQIKTVNVDSTPPTGAIANNFPKVNGIWQRSDLSAVPFVVTPNADVSGVGKYYVSETNVAPTLASSWRTYPAGAASASDTYAFSDISDSTKTLYAWFQDNAANISTAPVSASFIKDGTQPTVSKFFLRQEQDVTGSDSLVVPSDPQYSNNKKFYFAFVTQDEGSGPASFRFVEGSHTSDSFALSTNLAEQGSNQIKVSNVMVANTGSGTLVLGIVTLSGDSQGAQTVTLKVTDAVGNEMNPGMLNENAAGNCVYDSMPPSVTGVSVKDASNHDCYLAGDAFYTKDATNTVTITGSDVHGAAAVSGLNTLNVGVVTGSAFSSLPSSVTFTGTTATIPLTLTAEDGAKFLAVAPTDKAGNVASASTIKLYYDTNPPTVTFSIRDKNGITIGTLAAGDNDLIVTPTAINDLSSFKVYYDASDYYSKVKDPGSFAIFKRSGGTDTTCSLTGTTTSGNPSSLVTLSDYLKSGTYVVYLTVMDNVENAVTKKYGFIFDPNAPTIAAGGDPTTAVKVLIDGAGSTVARYIDIGGTKYYAVPVMAFPGAEDDGTPDAAYASYPLSVYLQATDRPAGDPEGSGIAKISDAVKNVTTALPSIEKSASESAEVAVNDRYVLLKSNTADSWPLSSYGYLAFTPTVYDLIGRSSTATTANVFVDDTLPSVTINNTILPWVSGYDTATTDPVYYVGAGASLDFTPADLPSSHPASGLKGYSFSTNATLPAFGDSWTAATSGIGITGNTTFTSTVPTGTPAKVYLYLCDNAGNRSRTQLSPGKLKRDVTPPSLTSANVKVYDGNGLPSYVSGTNVFVPTEGVIVTAKGNDRDVDTTGSGIASYYLYKNALLVGAGSPVTGGQLTSASHSDGAETQVFVDGTYLNSAVSLQVYVSATDNVGLTTSSATGFADTANAPTIVMDNQVPAISTCSNTGVGNATVINVSDTTTLTIPAADTADADGRPASGIKGWYLSASPSTPTAPSGALSAVSPTAGPAANTWYSWSGGASQTITAAFTQLVIDGGGNKTIYAFVVDNVGNVSVYRDVGEGKQFCKDTTAPSITITPAAKYAGGSDGSTWFVNGSATITFTVSDGAGSGAYQYLISSATYTSGAEIADASGVVTGSSYSLLPVSSYFSAGSPNTLYLYASDKAGNLSKVPLVRSVAGDYTNSGLTVTNDLAAQLDSTSPTVSSLSLNNGDQYANNQTLSAKITLSDADVAGISSIKLSGSSLSADASSIAVTANGTNPYSVLNVNTTNCPTFIVITLDTPCVEGGYITVSGVKVTTPDASSCAISAFLTDAAQNGPGTGSSDSILMDMSAPRLGSLSFVAPVVQTTGWTNSLTNNLTINQTDGTSHVNKIVVSGPGFSTLAGATYTVGGTAVTPTVSGGTVTLSTAADSGSVIVISGLTVTGGAGEKDITVTLTDTAGNSDSTSTKDASLNHDGDAPDAPTVAISTTGTYQSGSTYYVNGTGTTVTTLTGAETASSPSVSGLDHYYYTVDTNPTKNTVIDGTALSSLFAAGDATGLSHVFHFYQLDRAGNLSSPTTITFTKDTAGPTVSSATVTATAGSIGVNASKYYAQGAKIQIAASDTSGVASYAISTATTAGSVSTSNSLDTMDAWTAWNGSSQSVPFTSMLTGSTLYLYTKDNLGLVTQTAITDGTHGSLAWYQDTAIPTLSLATPSSTTISPSGTTIASGDTVYVNGTSVAFTATTGDADSGLASLAAPGGTVSGSTVTLNPSVTPYTVTVTDNVGLTKSMTVTVTADTTRPSIDFDSGCATGSGSSRTVVAKLNDSGSGVVSMVCTSGSVSYTAGNATGSISPLTGPEDYKITATDKVGNIGGKWFHLENTYGDIPLRVNIPEMWTISGLGSYTVTVTGVNCKSWVINDGTTDKASGNSSSISASLDAGTYYLKITDWESTAYTMSVTFTISPDGALASSSVFGNSRIVERLPIEEVNAAVRRQSFERARTTSTTNLPVWFSGDAASGIAARGPSGVIERATGSAQSDRASIGRAVTANEVSVEALHASALAAFGSKVARPGVQGSATASRIEKSSGVVPASVFPVVMLAPEGSPAFIAYARGLAALRGEGVYSRLTATTGATAPGGAEDVESPKNLWEKILTFFGLDKSDRRDGNSRMVGVVSE